MMTYDFLTHDDMWLSDKWWHVTSCYKAKLLWNKSTQPDSCARQWSPVDRQLPPSCPAEQVKVLWEELWKQLGWDAEIHSQICLGTVEDLLWQAWQLAAKLVIFYVQIVFFLGGLISAGFFPVTSRSKAGLTLLSRWSVHFATWQSSNTWDAAWHSCWIAPAADSWFTGQEKVFSQAQGFGGGGRWSWGKKRKRRRKTKTKKRRKKRKKDPDECFNQAFVS